MSIIRTDVTAVKLFEQFVIAGIGSSLYVHKKDTGKLVTIHHHILQSQKVYGIVPDKNRSKLLIFGGKQYRIFTRSNLEQNAFDFSPGIVNCNDWLHSGVWLADREIALLTAHNVVQIWDTTKSTIISQRISNDNSILYSGLLLPLLDDVLVFNGTVFSEVIISRCKKEQSLHHLVGHKGVIFSISCNPQKGIIVTTSDDRSVRIWSLISTNNDYETANYWDKLAISCIYELYGHSARVLRSCITEEYIISVGEDSGICFWDDKGKLLRKINAHHNAPIWSVDGDESHLITGGGDCSVILHPLTLATNYCNSESLKINEGSPKKLVFTARRNIVILEEKGNLIYCDINEKSEIVYKLKHESTYVMLCISTCKQIIAIADMSGNLDVFVENCKGPANICNIFSAKLPINNILSMNWAGNRHLILCSGNGDIYVIASCGSNVEIVSKFSLPRCKERWLTAAAMGFDNKLLIVGDRCGNIHFYQKDTDPIKTFSKVHGRYGPTTLNIKTNEMISTGRDGTVKYFSIINKNDVFHIKLTSSKDVGFPWVEKYIEPHNNLICGFQERTFLINDLKNNSKVIEVNCGGGHRSWDVIRYVDNINDKYEEIIKFIYLKNSDVNIETFQLSKIVSRDIICGTHSKEINYLKSHKINIDDNVMFLISGGEDTTLRVSSVTGDLNFRDEVILKQLSSVRTLKTHRLDSEKLLLISGGGRAQISIRTIKFNVKDDEIKVAVEDLVDFLIKGTDKERKGDKTWRNCSVDFDPETRIMDLEIIKFDDRLFYIYAGCSDSLIRIFQFKYDTVVSFKSVGTLNYHKTCILTTHWLKHSDKSILISCSTRGEVCFWNVTKTNEGTNTDDKPFFTTTANKSGINCFKTKFISETQLLIASGGDDNSIHIKLLKINDDLSSVSVTHSWEFDKYHSSQITGLIIHDHVIITASIDQRVTVLKINESETSVVYFYQKTTDVADVQGIDIVNYNE
ncbi:tRNA (34-2'-O)-methyltransferase regulator WDR6 [Battus philenor]|uniref:tRNA (34-2'-O)-methyltransferase regulator WDR6 n=1 Tax=Battus philenor TaxID=42288 RepID=UPI0035CFF3FE